jgi:hypothetical protein
MMKFLRSDSVQSTLRVIVFMTAVVVCLNLLTLPVLIALALLLTQDLSWVGPYVTALAAIGGAGIIGKALQKKYETPERKEHKDDSEETLPYLEKERHM